ncbi:ArsR/SmtB family transcription factor [Thermodesulfatator atlanticus]|uniref:ArsR/SmtB family transcription factor n=1 Tax=Thermodesulfatator atlanticus TaxID=501497 RepID=UPI0003B52A65|nr:metalloregulator ArsR/SmtB family transcription factor [Thermodesulfatator atlanticus]
MVTKLEKRLKALADGTRLKILVLLSIRPCCVCEMVEVIGFAQPTISRHLQRLVEAGFISFTKKGNYLIYSLAPEDQDAEEILSLVLKQLGKTPTFAELKASLTQADKSFLWRDL